MINLNNISIVFPNSSYKQIQMSGSKKNYPNDLSQFLTKGLHPTFQLVATIV